MDLQDYLDKLDLNNMGKSLLFSDLEDEEGEEQLQEEPVQKIIQEPEPSSPRIEKVPENDLNNVVSGLCLSANSPDSSKA